jgi:hypothetical protein
MVLAMFVGNERDENYTINQSISSVTSFLTRGIRHDSMRHEAR